MNTIIALKGRRKLGKSQTIRTVDELLRASYPSARVEHELRTKVDLRVVLSIDGVKIGIESQGDPHRGRLINGSLDLFVNVGCDVIVCATRTSGATVDAVNALQGFDIHWFEQPEKSEPYEQILRSLTMAKQIVEKVEASVRSKPVPARSMSATA